MAQIKFSRESILFLLNSVKAALFEKLAFNYSSDCWDGFQGPELSQKTVPSATCSSTPSLSIP